MDFGKEYHRKWHLEHPNYYKERYKRNPQRILLQNKKWREKNKDKIEKTAKKWRKFNSYRIRITNLNYKARRRGAKGSHTIGEWELLKKQYNFTCLVCGRKEPEIKLTADHIIPLSGGGSNWIENIQPLCRSCNSTKHTRIIKF